MAVNNIYTHPLGEQDGLTPEAVQLTEGTSDEEFIRNEFNRLQVPEEIVHINDSAFEQVTGKTTVQPRARQEIPLS